VENLAESPGMCSDGPGSAPIEIPKREAFSLRGSKKERGEKELSQVEEEKGAALFSSRRLGPTGARDVRTVRVASADCPRSARTVWPPSADGPLMFPEHPVLHLLPHDPRGRSVLPWRTVRQEQSDGPPYCRGRSDLLF
jgi:hypothetical protein